MVYPKYINKIEIMNTIESINYICLVVLNNITQMMEDRGYIYLNTNYEKIKN